MKTRISLVAAGVLALAASAFSAGTALATPINLGGHTGAITIKFSNFEGFLDPTTGNPVSAGTEIKVGDVNFGVFNITSITDPNTTGSLWLPGVGGNGYLVGVFNGITVSSINTSTGVTENTGGSFSVYAVSSLPSFGAGYSGYTSGACSGGTVGGSCYNGITNTGTPILTFDLLPGSTSADSTSTIEATLNTTTFPIGGNAGTTYAHITGGTDAAQFGRNGFTIPYTPFGSGDLSVYDHFCANQAGCNGQISNVGDWLESSQDPIGAFAVPEPGTLLIFGSGLLGLGLLYRQRRRRKDFQRCA